MRRSASTGALSWAFAYADRNRRCQHFRRRETARPFYAFDPPPEFFAAGPPAPGPAVFNILDYGAVADAAVDNRDAIQAAINVAHAAGGGIVYIPPGVYGLAAAYHSDGATPDPAAGGVHLLDNVFLKGAGIGTSVLRVMDGQDQPMTGIVRSPSGEVTNNFGLADLTLDGNRYNNPTAKIDGFYCGATPGGTDASSDIYVLRVEATNCLGYGFNPHEQVHRLTVEGCIADGNGIDGFSFVHTADSVISGNTAANNGRHGFNITATTNDCIFTDNIAHGNGSAGIVVQRGSDNIAPPSNLLIEGGESYGNGSDGVRILYAHDVVISGIDIHGNGRNGIRLEGSSHVTADGNILADNSRVNPAAAGSNAEIYIVQGNDTAGSSGVIHPASYNLISNNDIADGLVPLAPYSVREGSIGVDHTLVLNNSMSGAATSLVLLTSVTSSLVHAGTAGDETISGGPGNDTISGGPGNDLLYGGDGADLLISGTGTDRLYGGAGNDVYIIDQTVAAIVEQAGGGYETVLTSLSSLTIWSNLEQLVYTGTGNFTGAGNSLDNVLVGGAGDDTLSGNAGNDVLIGKGGSNIYFGGTGDDQFFTESGSDAIFEGANSGFDTVFSTFAGTTTLNANVEQLVLLGLATGGVGNSGSNVLMGTYASGAVALDGGAGSDQLHGAGFDDMLIGGTGDDILLGHAGANILIGGAGNDVFYVESGLDIVVELDGAGFDTVLSSVSGTALLASGVEQLVLLGAATGGIGNELDNVLIGISSIGPVMLDGGDGNDVLYGGALADVLNGGNGVDVLIGLGGDNLLRGGAGDDTYVLSSGLDIVDELAEAGLDTVYSSVQGATALAANVEQLVLFGDASAGIGNDLGNLLAGISSNGPVTLDGGIGDDVLYGGAFADALAGGAGKDILIGLGGANLLTGGAGDDNYILEGGTDTVVEEGGGGFDIVYSSAAGTTVLADHVEMLVIYGSAAGGAGNGLANMLYASAPGIGITLDGGTGEDTLFGNTGNDWLIGGGGNDLLIGGGGNDLFDYRQAGSGADTILDFDADPDGGQDLIDVSGRGFTAASIGNTIVIDDDGAGSTVITIGTDNVKLHGVAAASVTAEDFLL